MSTHTPGPWIVSIGPPEHVKHTPRKTRVIPDPTTGYDCIIATAEYGMYGPRQVGQAEANTRLIAAAPELLEALRLCIEALEFIPCRARNEAQAAIAKAEGRT